MALFLAMGGSGGGATVTLTFSSEFYGQTITATNGIKTVTKVAPSTGTMEISLPESGTWVISCTISGSTYSTSVEVDIDYTATLEAIPDGSTVLPTDDIQTWLKCAGITDKTTYTTLADVLADTDTFIALCADSNASDYMARSTTWASGVTADATAMQIVGKYDYCANALLGNATWASAIVNSSYADSVVSALVPTMTSNTTPSGECSASYTDTGFEPYKAFDGNDSTFWYSSTSAEEYIEYDFGTSAVANSVSIKPRFVSGLSYVKDFIVKGSNDKSSWDALYSGTHGNNGDLATFEFTNTTHYRYYRVYKNGSSYSDASIQICTLQFYGRSVKGYTGTVIHSAVEDTTYYMEGGQSVPFCTIASGDTETVLASTIESLKNQTITLYSSVAKDPDNLSNDYSKQIRITPNVTEIYLMPDFALYWYGSFNNCEDTTTANGWALTGNNPVSFIAPTHNKNSLTATSTSSYVWSGVGTKTLVSQSLTKLNAITTGISAGQYAEGEYFNLRANSGKSAAYATAYVNNPIKVSAMTKTTANVSASASYSAFIAAPWSSSGTIHALWLE